MGTFISIILSRQNLYTDDTFDYSDTSIEFKPSNENNNESTLSTGSSRIDWINFNNQRNYKDNGMDILA
jgi:hypothetical protein